MITNVLSADSAGNFRNNNARFKRAQLRDSLLFGLDQWIELGNLDGVATLLAFSETEDVSHVLGARTMKEPFVLADDGLAEGFGSLPSAD